MTTTVDMTGLEELPSGHFRITKKIRGEKIGGTYATPELAAQVRDAAIRATVDQDMQMVDGESVRALGERFIASRRSLRSVKSDGQRWRLHIATAKFATKPAVLVDKCDVLDWLDELEKKPGSLIRRVGRTMSWQTRKHCLNLLRRFFAWGSERVFALKGISNPCHDVVVPRKDGDEDGEWSEDWYLDLAEQVATIDAMPVEHDERRLLEFAMGSGLRQGELFCLHDEDVFLDDNPRAIVRYGSWNARQKRYVSPKGKTGEKKVRTVPLFGLALDAARAQRARVATLTKEENPHALFFPARDGGRRTKPPKSFSRVPKIARLKRLPWWHLLRHTCATSLLAGWWGVRWSLEDVCAVLGHSSVKVTERYAHAVPSVVQEKAVAAEAAFRLRPTERRETALRFHAGSTTPQKPERKHKNHGLLSRRSTVRIGLGVPNSSGRLSEAASGVVEPRVEPLRELVVRALEAIADQDPHRDRRCVDALVCVLDELDAAEALAPGTTKRKRGSGS